MEKEANKPNDAYTKISIIVPVYNAKKILRHNLEHIFAFDYPNYEVIVVDDCSVDSSTQIIDEFPCIQVKNKQKMGAGFSRNVGAKMAKGEILFFIDADVLPEKNCLSEVIKSFINFPDVVAVNGIYSKESANKGFVPAYLSLEKYYEWTHVKRERFTHFGPRIGAIKKEIFVSMGCFTEEFKGADIEDFEFSSRLSRKYKIITNPDIQGRHYWQSFWKRYKDLFRRSAFWVELFYKTKKFDNVVTTRVNAFKNIIGLLAMGFFLGSLFFSFFVYIGFFFLFIYFLGTLRFMIFLAKEKSFFFAIASFFLGLIFASSIVFGAIYGIIKHIIFNSKSKNA